MQQVTTTAKKIIANVEQVIVGKRPQIIQALVTWFYEGHLLLEDVPGVAKTILARALAASVGCTFRRIQCTPDLLPSDVTGASIFNPKTTEFEFRAGPIFAQIVLTDEINRTTPKSQSALLEAMEEKQVTIEGKTRPLPTPFFVIATQNPNTHAGTFPLPESQLDRFLMRIELGYADAVAERILLKGEDRRLVLAHHVDETCCLGKMAGLKSCCEKRLEKFVRLKFLLEIPPFDMGVMVDIYGFAKAVLVNIIDCLVLVIHCDAS